MYIAPEGSRNNTEPGGILGLFDHNTRCQHPFSRTPRVRKFPETSTVLKLPFLKDSLSILAYFCDLRKISCLYTLLEFLRSRRAAWRSAFVSFFAGASRAGASSPESLPPTSLQMGWDAGLTASSCDLQLLLVYISLQRRFASSSSSSSSSSSPSSTTTTTTTPPPPPPRPPPPPPPPPPPAAAAAAAAAAALLLLLRRTTTSTTTTSMPG